MDRERRQFALERNEQQSTLTLLRHRANQYREQIGSFHSQIAAAREQLRLIEPELEGLRTLKERGLVTINRLNTMERTAVELTARVASLQADIASAQAQISETEEQIVTNSQSRRVQAAAELGPVMSQLTELEGPFDQRGRFVKTHHHPCAAIGGHRHSDLCHRGQRRSAGTTHCPHCPRCR